MAHLASTNQPRIRTTRAALSRADLIYWLAEFGEAGLDEIAALIGFDRRPASEQQRLAKTPGPEEKTQGPSSEAQPLKTQTIPHQRPQARFFRVVEHRLIEQAQRVFEAPDWYATAQPISKDTGADPDITPPPPQPLAPWRRLWPFLRAALGSQRASKQMDIDQAVERFASGKTLSRLPYRQRSGWALRCQVIVDKNVRVLPFWEDFNRLCAALEPLRGQSGLEIVVLEAGPGGPCRPWDRENDPERPFSMPEAGTPVLVLSDLGCLDDDSSQRKAWLRFGQRLCASGVAPVALMPCPPRWWDAALVRCFYPVCWDRGRRFPRRVDRRRFFTGTRAALDQDPAAQRLLRLLSPAIRVEPALLRAVRYLMPTAEVDVGGEAAAWLHLDVEPTPTAFVYKTGAIAKHRAEYKQCESPALRRQVSEALDQHHAHLSPAVKFEERLIADELNGKPLDEQFMRRVVKTLFQRTGDEGMRAWVRRLAQRQHAGTWEKSPALCAAFAIVYEHVLQSNEKMTLPEGFDINDVVWVWATGEPKRMVLRQRGQALALASVTDEPQPHEGTWADRGSPLAGISLAAPRLQVTYPTFGDATNPGDALVVPVGNGGDDIVPLSETGRVWLKSDHEALVIDTLHNPAWASAIGRDEQGLFVAWREGQVDRRGYWVNPGAYPVKDKTGSDIGTLTLSKGYFQDESEYEAFQQRGFRQPEWADEVGVDDYGLYAEFRIANVVQRMRWIAPGQFMMGSPETESERFEDRELLHGVVLTRGLWLADTACTQALWQAVMGDNPASFKGVQRPVESVSWDDVQAFFGRLKNERPGLELRLPTEAEWEYACRAGTDTPFWFGDKITPEQVNYDGNFPYAGGEKGRYREETVDVKSLPRNGWGLYQMHGNVLEWCADWYSEYPSETMIDPIGSDKGASRVLRGGGWGDFGRIVRSAFRLGLGPARRGFNFGFRLARGQQSSRAQAEREPEE